MTLQWVLVAVLALALTACSDDPAEGNNVDPGDDAGDVTDVADAVDAPDAQPDAEPDAEPDATDASDAQDAVDAPDAPDADPDAVDAPDAEETLAPNPDSATQIADVASGNAGTIEQVAVTYTREAFGSDDAGFFVQATQDGPALFIAVDPTTTDPVLAQGDIITFDAETINPDANGRAEVTAIENLTVLDSGYDVTNLVQDVTDASDLVTNLDDYSQELVQADVTIAGSFGFAGGGHIAADVDTGAISGNTSLDLRVPEVIQDQLALHEGCTLTVGPTPLWRFNDTAQLSIWALEDVQVANCDAPTLDSAIATSDTEVTLTFNRNIDASSINDVDNQFTIDPALSVNGFSVDGNTVTLDTDAQTGGTEYTVTVADTVTDIFGAGVDTDANSQTFFGFVPPAEVVLNEVNANISGGCDLIELRVTSGGSLDGFSVWERGSAVASFSGGFTVQTGDFVIIHFDANDSNCNPNGATSEINAVDEQSEANFPENFDTAYDWWTNDSGITATNNVLRIEDATDTIVDAVFLVNESICQSSYNSANATESAADTVAQAGEWERVSGGQPANGFVDQDFCEHAVPDLDDTGSDASGTSIQRTTNGDNNNKNDWNDVTSSTWGQLNTGQTAF